MIAASQPCTPRPQGVPAPPAPPATGDTQIFALREKAGRAEALARNLSEFASALTLVQSETDVLWDISQRCVSILGFEHCAIYLLNGPRDTLAQRTASRRDATRQAIPNPIEIPIGRGIVGGVAATGIAELVPDTALDVRCEAVPPAGGSEIAVPILSEGRVLGVIDSQHPDAHHFTNEHLTVLTAVTSMCATMLERARAEQALRELNNQLEERVQKRTAELAASNSRLQREVAERIKIESALQSSAQRLKESEDRFRRAFRAIPAEVSIVRASDMRFIEVNESFLQSSGYTKAEVIGKTSVELGLWVDLEDRRRFLEQFRRDGYVHSFESRMRAKCGRIDHSLISAERIEIDRQPCILALNLVMTERVRAEEELKQALARERELSRLRTAFVSLVSHEFRTPLGVIHSSAEILDRYIDSLPSSDRKSHLHAIQSHAMRMANLMEGVLVFGSAEAGKLEFRPMPFNLPEACRRWIDEQRIATDGRCPIRASIPDNLPGLAQGDPEILRHVVSNLLSNAVKYSPPDSPIDVIIERDQDLAVIHVSDRGVGIPAADRDQLFTAFRRGRNVAQVPGTGLGLVVIRHCLDLHQGTIEIQSAENQGTTVTVRVPLFPSQP